MHEIEALLRSPMLFDERVEIAYERGEIVLGVLEVEERGEAQLDREPMPPPGVVPRVDRRKCQLRGTECLERLVRPSLQAKDPPEPVPQGRGLERILGLERERPSQDV